MNNIPSLYIHIPFCRKRCSYCDFYAAIYRQDLATSYVDVLLRQIRSLGRQFKTIYVGGGTPSALANRLLERLLKSLEKCIGRSCEFTIEANPESLDEEKIRLLLDSGVNRLSIGAQSFNDERLRKLGRIHDRRKALDSIRLSKKIGFKNIGVDLIFGAWCDSLKDWKEDLELIPGLAIQHISCYALTYEKNTPVYRALQDKSLEPLDDEIARDMYNYAIDFLSSHGFKQYEVSNFAKEEYRCRHNLNYWENNSYIGLGASAVSYIKGSRDKNISDVEEYIRRINNKEPLLESREKLSPIKRAKETAAVKIRTVEGIDFEWFKIKTGFDFLSLEKDALPRLIEGGLIRYKKDSDRPIGICLERKGLLFCDTISSALL